MFKLGREPCVPETAPAYLLCFQLFSMGCVLLGRDCYVMGRGSLGNRRFDWSPGSPVPKVQTVSIQV